jgi:RNA polymerase sigma-70 factor (ECF subfamily)
MNSPRKASRRGRSQATDKERREKLQRLSLCREKLSPEEAELLHEVFPDLFDAYCKPVWDYIRRRGLPSHDAEDLLQETFVLLHEHILDEGFPDSLIAMLISIADGKVVNYLRGKRRAPMSLGLPSSRSEKPTSGVDIDRALDLRGVAEQILPQLSPQHREVIEKLVLHGLSYRDAAEVLNIPEGTLRSRLIAAKRALAELAEPLLPPSQRGRR